MTQAIKKKLRSNEGASLMVALLFFVMCATVGSIILAAATASSGRLANLRKEDQSYYAITSAEELFAKMMEENKVVLQLNESGVNVVDPPDPRVFLNPKDMTTVDGTKLLLPSMIVGENLYPVLKYGDTFPEYSAGSVSAFTGEKEVTITIQDESGLTVKAKVSMNKALDLKVVFTSEGTTGSATMKFKPLVEKEETIKYHDMLGRVTDSGDERNATHTTTYTISWIDPVTE